MASLLLGKTLLGRKFEQDTNKDYIKINDITMGNSIYGYKIIKGDDISKILADNLKDQNVVCLVYDAKCGNCFIKNGFNLNSPIDYSDLPGFTTYIVKNRIGRFLKAPLPASIVTPKVPSVPVTVPSVVPSVPSVPVTVPSVPSVPSVVPWNGSRINYTIGSIVSYNGNIYKCITPHTSQSDWLPNIVPSLWQLVPNGTVPQVPQVPSVPSVPSVPVTVPSVPSVPQVPLSNSRNLSTLLNGKAPIGVYFQSWSSGWASSGSSLDLAKIDTPTNIVYLSFVRPETTYTSGTNSLSGTGLDFSSDFNVVKDAIKILRNKGIVVMLSVGGATYPFNTYNASNVAQLTKDLGCNGIDIDWENHNTRSEFGSYIQKTRDALGPNMCVSTAGFSVGAYGEGEFANAPPVSDYRGMNIQGLKSHGKELDWINIMSYDASPAFSSTQAFDAYRSMYNGPLLIGFEPPPEAWGGHILTLDTVRKHCEYVKNKNGGAFVWSYQKQGPPHCPEIVNLAFEIFKDATTVPSVPSVPSVISPSVPSVPSVPVTVSQGKTLIAPYIYSWSLGNSVYKIDSLKTAMNKINLKAASYAFVISDGGSKLNISQQNIDDMKAFVSAGNTLIISCGGANGPFIQDTMNKEQIVSSLSGILNVTGSRHLDFDIEGSSLPNTQKNNLLNSAIVELQRIYPKLYVSYTIPIGDPKWGAITPDGINLINNAKNMGVDISRVNGMIMDLNSNTDWSTMAISMCEGMYQQLSQIFNGKDIYNLIGATFMCGVEDTNSIFRVTDAQILALYAKQKGLGMVSYWSINRDQVGTGELGVYSKVNTVDYEYYKTLTNILI